MNCPSCGNPHLLTSDAGLFCNRCWQTVKQNAPPRRYKAVSGRERGSGDTIITPAIGAGRTSRPFGSERELVQAIREELTRRSWRVWRIGQHVVRGSGSDEGVMDLLCVKPAQKPYPAVIRLIEVKFGRNRPTKEQQELIDTGAARAVWTVEEALEYCNEGAE